MYSDTQTKYGSHSILWFTTQDIAMVSDDPVIKTSPSDSDCKGFSSPRASLFSNDSYSIESFSIVATIN